jgi:DNA invertase Pin-like site-specific DNA recombinase
VQGEIALKQRAAAYIRVSTADQTEFSPDAQLKQIKEYVNKNNMILLDEYIYADEGISGRSTGKRIGFNKMIKDAKRKPKPFDVILIHKFNRFARNREDAIIFKSLLKRDCGIKVISITEPIEDDKIGIIIESILDAFSEYYSINLSEEVKKGMCEKASRGGVQSRPPFGYDIKDNKLVINQEEANIVKIIFDKFINKEFTYLHIANYLNEMGIKTKNGMQFQSKTIKYILTNPTYKGYLLWNKKEKNGSIRASANWILAKGDFEPLLTEQEFEKARMRVEFLLEHNRKNSNPSGSYKHFLSGLIICQSCGGRMVYTKSGELAYFRCRKAKEGGCFMKASIRADMIEKAILEQVERDLDNVELLVTDVERTNNDDDLLFYKQQLKNIEYKFNQVKQAYLNGVDSLEEYKESKKTFLKEKEVLMAHISVDNMYKDKAHMEVIFNSLGRITDVVNGEYTIEKKSKVLKSFIKQIVLDLRNDSFEIEYYLSEEE